MSISLIGYKSLELVPVLVFSFKSLDPKNFSFSEKSLWFKGPLIEIKKKPGLNLFDIWEGKSSRAARSQASFGCQRVLGRKKEAPAEMVQGESTHGLYIGPQSPDDRLQGTFPLSIYRSNFSQLY